MNLRVWPKIMFFTLFPVRLTPFLQVFWQIETPSFELANEGRWIEICLLELLIIIDWQCEAVADFTELTLIYKISVYQIPLNGVESFIELQCNSMCTGNENEKKFTEEKIKLKLGLQEKSEIRIIGTRKRKNFTSFSWSLWSYNTISIRGKISKSYYTESVQPWSKFRLTKLWRAEQNFDENWDLPSKSMLKILTKFNRLELNLDDKTIGLIIQRRWKRIPNSRFKGVHSGEQCIATAGKACTKFLAILWSTARSLSPSSRHSADQSWIFASPLLGDRASDWT